LYPNKTSGRKPGGSAGTHPPGSDSNQDKAR